jgi:hypothetical protein
MHVRVILRKVAAGAGSAVALGARALTQHFLYVCVTQVTLQICASSSSSSSSSVTQSHALYTSSVCRSRTLQKPPEQGTMAKHQTHTCNLDSLARQWLCYQAPSTAALSRSVACPPVQGVCGVVVTFNDLGGCLFVYHVVSTQVVERVAERI